MVSRSRAINSLMLRGGRTSGVGEDAWAVPRAGGPRAAPDVVGLVSAGAGQPRLRNAPEVGFFTLGLVEVMGLDGRDRNLRDV